MLENNQNHGTPSTEQVVKAKRGFAAMDEHKRREIASKGGRAAHEQGVAHRFDSEEARAAGRKGGLASSRKKVAMPVSEEPLNQERSLEQNSLHRA
jgi:general stress protein YciG